MEQFGHLPECERPQYAPHLISWFFDGAQVYKRKVAPFWPLVVGIENLPPHIRYSLGKGRFMLGLLTASGVGNEKFLMRDLLMEEIESLKKGWLVKINNVSFFVIVRASLQFLDMKALEKQANIKLTNSYAPCFRCRCIKGVYPAVINQIVLYNHRRLCDEKHFTRFCGQTQKNCPKGYYELTEMESKVDKNETYFKQPVQYATNNKAEYYAPRQLDLQKARTQLRTAVGKIKDETDDRGAQRERELLTKHLPDDLKDTSDRMRNLLQTSTFNLTTDTMDYHSHFDDTFAFDRSVFEGKLYYRFCELSPQKVYKTTANLQFFYDGLRAEQLKTTINGVKGNIPAQHKNNVEIDDIPFDDFHGGKNEGLARLDDIDRTHKYEASKIVTYCRKGAVFPSIAEREKTSDNRLPLLPWQFSPSELKRAESWVNCIYLPKGYSGKFQLVNIFQQKGNLRGTSIVCLSTCGIWEIIMFSVRNSENFEIQYRVWNCLMSRYISDIFKNVVKVKGADADDVRLLYRAIEITAIKEGLYPETAATPTAHQVIEMPTPFKPLGPARCTTTLAGERTIGSIKKCLKIGGSNPDLTVFSRYFTKESAIMRATFGLRNESKRKKSKSHVVDEINVTIEAEGGLYFDDKDIELSEPLFDREKKNEEEKDVENDENQDPNMANENDHRFEFTAQEMTALLIAINDHLLNVVFERDEARCLRESSWYRLVLFFLQHSRKAARPRLPPHFLDFIREWNALRRLNEPPPPGFRRERMLTAMHLRSKSKEEILNILYKDKSLTVSDVNLLVTLAERGLQVRFFKVARICGITFKGRGLDYRETAIRPFKGKYGNDVLGYYPSNLPKNRLSAHWQKSVKHRCWCKHVAGRDAKAKIRDGSTEHYACINFFLQLIVPNDQLNGLVFASIVCRKAIYVDRVPFISGWDDESLCEKHQFVSVRQIEMTGIGALPFDRGNNAMKLNHAEFKQYGRFRYADGQTLVPSDPYQPYAPTGLGYPEIRLPNVRSELRTQVSRWKQLPGNFKPFCVYTQRRADSADGCSTHYSSTKKLSKLGCLIPVELDRENVGWKWWNNYYDLKFRRISNETVENAAVLTAPPQAEEDDDDDEDVDVEEEEELEVEE